MKERMIDLAVLATQSIRRMRGGAQAQLLLGEDRQLWVVKFLNNPQGERILANEFLATRIADAVGLTVPQTDVVKVNPWLIENSPDMWVETRGVRTRCAPGLHFGSLFVGGLMPGRVVDYLPEEMLPDVRNLPEFAGILCVDKWLGNADGRQAVFSRTPRERYYRATFIDQGFCFHANEWAFSDAPLRGVFVRNQVYASVTGWDSFEPWLSTLETLESDKLMGIADSIPEEWYGAHKDELERLVESLVRRRSKVRELITDFRDSDRLPFPNWARVKKTVVSDFPQKEVNPPTLRHNCIA